jgi:hypothetical protein
MLRWLLLVGISLGLVTGMRNGWIELRWDRLLHDAGVPFVPDPDRPPDATPAAPEGAVREPGQPRS